MARGTGGGGGQTQTQTPSSTVPQITTSPPRQPVLHLRGALRRGEEVEGDGTSPRSRRRIQWAEDVIDNEGLGRKKSKVCCIYHAPKPIDESSDESSSDSDDNDSGDESDGGARLAKKEGCINRHGHSHEKGKGNGNRKGRSRSPNAYEKMPKGKDGGAMEKE